MSFNSAGVELWLEIYISFLELYFHYMTRSIEYDNDNVSSYGFWNVNFGRTLGFNLVYLPVALGNNVFRFTCKNNKRRYPSVNQREHNA